MLEPAASTVSCFSPTDDFIRLYTAKISTIRQSIANAPPPIIYDHSIEPLTAFRPLTLDEITELSSNTPSKQCFLDPAPTYLVNPTYMYLVKQIGDIIAPVISAVCNAMFAQTCLPVLHKPVVARTLLNKPRMEVANRFSCRPI